MTQTSIKQMLAPGYDVKEFYDDCAKYFHPSDENGIAKESLHDINDLEREITEKFELIVDYFGKDLKVRDKRDIEALNLTSDELQFKKDILLIMDTI